MIIYRRHREVRREMLNSQNSRRDLNLQENSQENSSAASTYYESFASSTNENENHLYENVV